MDDKKISVTLPLREYAVILGCLDRLSQEIKDQILVDEIKMTVVHLRWEINRQIERG